MSRKLSRASRRHDEFEDDSRYENGYHDKLVEHRKNKRLKNAIKSKNIQELMHLDEDDFY